MKKVKLSLEKFKVSTLSNKSSIIGGTDVDPNGGETQTGKLKLKKEVCVYPSEVYIKG